MVYGSGFQKTRLPLINHQRRSAWDVETQDYAGGSISLINLARSHRRDYTRQGNALRRRETAMPITGQQIHSITTTRRRDDVHLAVAIKIHRADEVGPFRQFH